MEIGTQNILVPDELDARNAFTAFYGMTAQLYGNIYWGFLQPFKWNTDLHSELTYSRDGIDFQRLPTRPKAIELGPEGAWDDRMVYAANQWVEVGDEWWLYYSGWDGPHGADENRQLGRWRAGAVGLTKLRKEGFISMRGPANGGVIVTRKIRWPGGKLLVNADARNGELKVRVTDEKRQVMQGLDYVDCVLLNGDKVRHRVSWKNETIESLKGKVIRLEFFLKNSDLYTFLATGSNS